MGVYSCNTAAGSNLHQTNTSFASLSPLGVIAQKVLRTARTEERGTPLTPVVAVIDLYLGYNTGMRGVTADGARTKWGVLAMSAHDLAFDYLLHQQLFVPAAGAQDEELKTTPVGEIIDVALSDSEADYLALYPVVLLVGDHDFAHASGLAARLLAALQPPTLVKELLFQQFHLDAMSSAMGAAFVKRLNATGKLKIIAPTAAGAQPAASIAVDSAELRRIGREHLPVVVSATAIPQAAAQKAPPNVLWQVNAQKGGGFVVELSNEWGVSKAPCGHQNLQAAGAATVTLELRQAVKGATVREWLSGNTIHTGDLRTGDTLNFTIAPGNTSFVEFMPATKQLKHDDELSATPTPRLSGIFASITTQNAAWNSSLWLRELKSMKAVGLKFLILPHPFRGISNATQACPLGRHFASTITLNSTAFGREYFPSDCFVQGPDVITNVLTAAKATGLGVFLGLSLNKALYKCRREVDGRPCYPWDRNHVNQTELYAALQIRIASLFDDHYGSKFGSTLKGFYTEVEESNFQSWLDSMPTFAERYLQPLSEAVHALNPRYQAFASPYNIRPRIVPGTKKNITSSSVMTPGLYAALWAEVFSTWAPALDVIAPQDSVGANGNTLSSSAAFLGNLSAVLPVEKLWSNVELFESYPIADDPSSGRRPANMTRIAEQLCNEGRIVSTLIAWEWFSCLSPHGGDAGQKWPAESLRNYQVYKLLNSVIADL